MPVFISDEDLAGHATDASYVAARADEYIRALQSELDTVRATADAASITAEQTCSLVEQKYLSLLEEYSKFQTENAQLQSSLDDRISELARVQAEKHQVHLQSIGKDGEIERLKTEVSELQKSKRQVMDLVEQKDSDISEKNAIINGHLDKIVNLTNNVAQRESRICEIEAELARSHATCTRLLQEKELIERHNAWLNDELTAKVDSLIELRRTHADYEEETSAKLADAEKRFNDCSSSLKWNKERIKDLETKLTSLQEELLSSKEAAAAHEEQFSAELSTANKLVGLYKESSEEWSKKAGELEGVIKALETHLSQVESDYKGRLERELAVRNQVEKEAAELKNKLEKCEAEIERSSKSNELNLLPLSSFTTESWMQPSHTNDVSDNNMLVPKIPVGVSGTALAASLLRDGWSLAKMYAKYQEAVDALRHEQFGRKESEAILQRVLCELEEKAGVILDERAEYDRMVESYSIINKKLQQSVSEQANLEKIIQELKADLRRHEREYSFAQKDIVDLQKQVTVLLKECRDIQLRCGSLGLHNIDTLINADDEMGAESDLEKVTFKDIDELVKQNVELKSQIRDLSDQVKNREIEYQGRLKVELEKHTEDATSKVTAVLQRAEEQVRMIESLHSSVAMYKRLYEEEHKLHLSYSSSAIAAPVAEDRRKDLLLVLEGSQEATKKAQEKTAEQLRSLDENLAKSRSEIISLRSERDKLALDAKFAAERLDSYMKEFEHQRIEKESILARNVELSSLIISFQRQLRDSSQALHSSEEQTRKLTMEVSVLKHEKEMLSNAEKRACDEVRSLSERVYRLQASLDTIQTAEEAREEARVAERRKQEEYINQIEREWAEAKKELQQERDNVRALTSDRELTLKNSMRQVEEMSKELANALRAVSNAENRAAVAETKLSELEKKIKTSEIQVANVDGGAFSTAVSATEVVTDMLMEKEEIKKLREEAHANKEHMLQYKSIAQVNEAALKQMEASHENFKIESEKLKESLQTQILSYREKILELEKELILKAEEATSAALGKEEALASSLAEITHLKEEYSCKISQVECLEIQVSAFKENLEKEHERWHAAQANYERQVILQSETIQELTKTSQALALQQQEAADLRKLANDLKSENDELKARWLVEKSMLEESKIAAEKKYDELNEQNNLLHTRLEALHIQLAEKERTSAGMSSGHTTESVGDMQKVVNYLRTSKELVVTEVALLKQEKLRLESQLERAQKEAEAARASLNKERENSRALLHSEQEMKSLQLQVTEINLLRESNMQLREENKHNFEEWQKMRDMVQKARADSEALESLLRERQIEIEACKKENEMERMEKENLEKRISELLARSKGVDVEDYERMKDIVEQMQVKLKEKDAEIERIKSNHLEAVSKFEQDLAKSEAELSQREKRINDLLQSEATLKSEVEKQKRINLQWKRKSDNLSKEKDKLNSEKTGLCKQIEDLKQQVGKRSIGNIAGEQVMKDKEEKERRIQTLERIVEKTREELRKEKEDSRKEREDHEKEKAMREKGKSEIPNELAKHKQALHRVSDELEKLKHAEGSLPEASSVVQFDNLSAAYMSAAENFEKVAHAVSVELGVTTSMEITSIAETSTMATTSNSSIGVASSSQSVMIPPVGATRSHLAAKAVEEKERELPGSRRQRRLIRPRLPKPEEPQGDAEMTEADGSGGKLAPSHEAETQHQLVARKRQASPASELSQQLLNQGQTNADVAEPVIKRSKNFESGQEGAEGQSAAPSETPLILQAVDESADMIGDFPQVSSEGVTEKEEVGITGERSEAPKDLEQSDEMNQFELQNERNEATVEMLNKPSGIILECDDDGSKDQAGEDNQQPTMELETEMEEGELVPGVLDGEEVVEVANPTASPDMVVGVSGSGTTPSASPARIDDEALVGVELGINTREVATDEKNDEGNVVSDTAEASNKSNAGNDQIAEETARTPENATECTSGDNADASKQGSSVVVEPEESKQVSPPAGKASTIVNLQERAKLNAQERLGGMVSSSSVVRGRGRASSRHLPARGTRGRGGRGQSPSQQR